MSFTNGGKMKKLWIITVLLALYAGLIGQFVWKMIYFPEPLMLVIIELILIGGLVSSAIYTTIKE